MPTAVIAVVFVFLVGLALRFALPLGEATDQKATSQSAADAAALAAAKQIREDLPGAIAAALGSVHKPADLPDLFDALGPGLGRGKAVEYADHNGADVQSYQYDRWSDLITVRVQGRRAATTGDRSVSFAEARLGPRFGACRLDDDPTTPPDPDDPPPPPPDPDDPPPPPPPVGTSLQCGDFVLHFTFTGTKAKLDTSLRDLQNQMKPRLVG